MTFGCTGRRSNPLGHPARAGAGSLGYGSPVGVGHRAGLQTRLLLLSQNRPPGAGRQEGGCCLLWGPDGRAWFRGLLGWNRTGFHCRAYYTLNVKIPRAFNFHWNGIRLLLVFLWVW